MALIPSLDSDIYGRRKTVISLWCGKVVGGRVFGAGRSAGGWAQLWKQMASALEFILHGGSLMNH